MMKSLFALKRAGVREIPTPHYSPVAMMVRRHLLKRNNPIWTRLWVNDDEFITHEYHHLEHVISWQKSVYVSTLISIGSLPIPEMESLYISDPTPRMVVYGSVRLLCDGNHRFWWLRQLGYETFPFLTVHVTDRDIEKVG